MAHRTYDIEITFNRGEMDGVDERKLVTIVNNVIAMSNPSVGLVNLLVGDSATHFILTISSLGRTFKEARDTSEGVAHRAMLEVDPEAELTRSVIEDRKAA